MLLLSIGSSRIGACAAEPMANLSQLRGQICAGAGAIPSNARKSCGHAVGHIREVWDMCLLVPVSVWAEQKPMRSAAFWGANDSSM